MSKYVFNPFTGNLDTVLSKASELSYDNTTSGLTATNVQAGIDEVQANILALPNPITYIGTWDASTNTPTLANTDTGKDGYLYQVNVAGTVDFGAGNITFAVGDKVVNNATIWQKWDMTDAVISVNGFTGAVTLVASDVGAPSTAITISAGTGLSGGGDLSANRTITLADTSVTPSSYGSASEATIFTVDAQGRLSSASSTPIAITASQVAGLSGTNSGDVTLAAVGVSPNANAATLTGQVLALQPFDSTNPGVVLASAGGTSNFLRADGTWAAPTGTIGANVTLSNLTSPTAINQNLTFDTSADKSLTIANVTGATAKNLTVQAGSAVTGSNLASGNLILRSGVGTGTTSIEDQIQFYVSKAAGSASAATTSYKAAWLGAGASFTRFKIAAQGSTDGNANLFFTAAASSYGISSGTPPDGTSASLPFTITTLGSTTVNNAGAPITLTTGSRSGTAASGDATISTGNNTSSGNSGNVILQPGTSTSGTRGKIQFKDGSEGSTGAVWTSVDTAGSGGWAASGGSTAYRSVVTTDTATNNDSLLVLSGASFTETLPTAVGNTGKTFTLSHNGTSLTQVYTLATTGGQTIGGIASGSYALYTNGETLKVISDGANWIILEHKTSTGWVSFTPTGTWSTNTTYTGQWRRVGTQCEFDVYITTAGAPTTANLKINAPSGMTFVAPISGASTRVGMNANYAAAYNGSAQYWGAVYWDNSTSDVRVLTVTSATDDRLIPMTNTAPFTFASGDEVGLRFTATITGWQP